MKMRQRYGLKLPKVHHKEAPEGEGEGEATTTAAGEGEGEGDDKGKGEGKTYTQAEIDAMIERRLAREKEKAKQEADNAKAKAKAEALKEQEKFQELAESETQRADKAEALVATVSSEKQELEAKVERYEAALTKYAEEAKKGLDKSVLELLEGRDVSEQLEWLSKNAESLRKNKEGVPPTPKSGNTGASKERDEQAKTAMSRRYSQF